MIIARFSLRWLLVLMVAFSIIFLFVSLALQGRHWAIALCAAGASLIVCILVQALCFLAARILAEAVGRMRPSRTDDSPFAGGPFSKTLPLQVIPPDNSLVE